jgi:hypothetical protein
MLFAFVFSLFPIPLIGAKPKGGQPYPCQHCACGCSSAEQCWKSCCCYNDQQKLAWAKKHGVKPPTWFVAKIPTEDKGSARSCCSAKTKEQPSCCSKSTTSSTSKPSCCSAKPEPSSKTLAMESSPPSRRWIVLEDAMRCKGLAFSLDKGVPKCPTPTHKHEFVVSSQPLCFSYSCFMTSVGLLPPTPPPRGC